MSSDVFPTKNYAVEMLLNRPGYMERVFSLDLDEITFRTIRESFTSVSIRFDSLSVIELVEEPALTITDLVSNLGGIVGLFIAASFLSCMDLVDLTVAISIIEFGKLRKRNKIAVVGSKSTDFSSINVVFDK